MTVIDTDSEQTICLLTPEVANQIAAGEVIERPASVVKELLENSIDAGAGEVFVMVEQAGRRLIRVRDNGTGIRPIDLPWAIARHATSKLKTITDLESMDSLGFRGEALASIASVSVLSIQSRALGSHQGFMWAEGSVTPCAHPTGTTISVLDLFYNVPVRRRFLKSDQTEYHHILEVIHRVALSQPQCGIHFYHDDQPIVRLAPALALKAVEGRIQKIMGRAFIEQSAYCSAQGQGIAIQGWIGSPLIHQAHTGKQFLFLNGRVVRDRLLNRILTQIYDQKIPSGRYPSYVLYLTMDPQMVDINVHPTKQEVRFRDVRWVQQFLMQKLLEVLEKLKGVQSAHSPEAVKDSRVPLPVGRPVVMQRGLDLKDDKDDVAQIVQASNTVDFKISSLDLGKPLALLPGRVYLLTQTLKSEMYCIDLKQAYACLANDHLTSQWTRRHRLAGFTLGLPQRIARDQDLPLDYLSVYGFCFNTDVQGVVWMTAIPEGLVYAEPLGLLHTCLSYRASADHAMEVIGALAQHAFDRIPTLFELQEHQGMLERLERLSHPREGDQRLPYRQLTEACVAQCLGEGGWFNLSCPSRQPLKRLPQGERNF
jgi:DNA mismatch repair protein MutL